MIQSELRSFHAVATYGGFSAAAKEIFVSQPTLSTQIKALETRYGVELFYRSSREVRLTVAGEQLFKITSRMFQAEMDADDLLSSFKGLRSGKLRLAAVGPFHATDMIVAFKEQYPGIEVEVQFGNSQECFERILNFNSDVAIIAEVPSDDRVLTQTYSTHDVVVFVSSDHPFYQRDGIRLAELDGENIVKREMGSTTRSATDTILEAKGISVNTILELGSREAVWKAVERGIGVGFVADFEFVAHTNLKKIPIDDTEIKTKYYLAYHKERAQSILVRSFCDTAISIV